jgi:hypothetical protein
VKSVLWMLFVFGNPSGTLNQSNCQRDTEELLVNTKEVITKWGSLLQKFLKGSDDEVWLLGFELILDALFIEDYGLL